MSVRCSTRTPRRPGPALRICQMQRDALATRPTYQSLNRQHDAFDRGRIDRMFTGKISDTRMSDRPRALTPHLIRERPMPAGATLRRTVSGAVRCRASERSPRDVSTAWTAW